MKIKVTLADGSHRRDLFWLRHTGSDIYCGPLPSTLKWSYHKTGDYHVQDSREYIHQHWEPRLHGVAGFFQISGLAIPEVLPKVDEEAQASELSKDPVNCVITIDVRSLGSESGLHLTVGVLQPHQISSLSEVIHQPRGYPEFTYSFHQLHIVGSVTPWVVVLTHCSKRLSA